MGLLSALIAVIVFPYELLTFGWTLSFSDAKILLRTAFYKQFYPKGLEDDRQNLMDLNLRIIAKAPQNNSITKSLIGSFLQQLWDYINKPFAPVVLPQDGASSVGDIPINHRYRMADGRGNAAKFPTVGMGNTRYSTILKTKHKFTKPLPPPEKIFNLLMKRGSDFKPHPNGINVLMFELATIITHDLFWTDSKDLKVNIASSYADLQTLYGRTTEEVAKIRSFKDGKLKPDFFTDVRMCFHPAGVGALLVLFSRNHNYIAEKILSLNEDNRFSRLKYSPEELDEHVFQTARLINAGCYVNLIIGDYLRTILGLGPDSKFLLNPAATPPAFAKEHTGNHSSVSFNYFYRWHSSIGEENGNILPELVQDMRANITKLKIEDGLPLHNVRRGKDNKFLDKDLAEALRKAMTAVAGHLGALNIPDAMLPYEVSGINQGREGTGIQQPTLNEFREHFNLKRYTTFEEFNTNPRVVAGLKELYGTPDDVELYPGLVCEQTQDKAGGVGVNEGISLGYTTSVGILADATNLIRNDRFYTDDFNARNLTEWGYQLCVDPANAGVVAYNGSIMAHLLSLLGGEFKPDEPCVKVPFRILSK